MIEQRSKLPPAYWQGMDAYLDGKTIEDNPYIPKSNGWLWWRRGFWGTM